MESNKCLVCGSLEHFTHDCPSWNSVSRNFTSESHLAPRSGRGILARLYVPHQYEGDLMPRATGYPPGILSVKDASPPVCQSPASTVQNIELASGDCRSTAEGLGIHSAVGRGVDDIVKKLLSEISHPPGYMQDSTEIKASRHQNVNKLERKTNQEHDFPTSPEKIDQSDEVNSLQKEAMEIDDERESTENKQCQAASKSTEVQSERVIVDSYEQTKYEDQEKGAENVEKKMSEKSDNEQNNNVNNMDSHSESQTINRTDKGKSLQKDNTEHDSHNTSSENKESVSQPQAGEHTEAEQECVFGNGRSGNKQNSVPKTETGESTKKKKQNGEDIEVHFHVIVSPKFDFQPDKDEVYIRFHHHHLGGFGENKWKMTFKRELPEAKGYMVMHGTVPIPKSFLCAEKHQKYKYVVMKANEEKSMWEFLLEEGNSTSIVDRKLMVPKEKYEEIKVWHQYDGALLKKPKTNAVAKFISWIKGSPEHKKALEVTKIAFKAMLPKWAGFGNDHTSQIDDIPAEDIFEEIIQVCLGARYCFGQDSFITEEMKSVLYEYIYPWIRGIAVDSHDYDREEPEAAELRLAAGFLVVLLISKYSLSLDEKDVIKLCHALCLRPDKNHDLHDLKGLAKHYNKMKRNLKDYLKIFLLDNCEKTPMWVLAIPLYHLLRDDLKQTYLNKNHCSENWWGTVDLNQHIKRFHQSGKFKDSVLERYWDHLIPLFSHDPVLPRTLMAVVTWKYLSQDNIHLFTVEAVLGNIYVSLKKSTDHEFIKLFEWLITSVRKKKKVPTATLR